MLRKFKLWDAFDSMRNRKKVEQHPLKKLANLVDASNT